MRASVREERMYKIYLVVTRATCSAGACVQGHGASSVLTSNDELALMECLDGMNHSVIFFF